MWQTFFMPWRIFVAGVALVMVGCGSSRVLPTPSPSPSSLKLGGVVSGHYLLQIQPGPGCAMRKGSLSFPMTAASAGTVPHPGDQILLEGDPSSLELELESSPRGRPDRSRSPSWIGGWPTARSITTPTTTPCRRWARPMRCHLGRKDLYRGFMSLGEGGFVTVDMGTAAVDGPGPDVRVFQTTSGEPVTLYAANRPEGPFTLVRLQRECGERTPGIGSNHCDFDLHDAGLSEARYLKIEDGEIYPCLAGGTVTKGADIDAVQILNPQP